MRSTFDAEPPPKKTFDMPWLVTIVFVVLAVGGATFFATARLSKNTKAVAKTCQARNQQITSVNAKFAQLNFIFDAALKHPAPGSAPPSEEILRLFAEFSKPIPPVSCKEFN